ncbi:oxidoreductase [Kwoniella mangroviensis CBS 8886]|nr:oxidoreductase [Kwoniella mangroviensis CBS 8886]
MTKSSQPIFPYPPKKVDGYPTYLPDQLQPVGSLLDPSVYKQNQNPPKLFEPLTIRGVEFPNRAWVAPMCQYSSDEGKATDHHFVHLGSMAMRGWGSIMVEATAVVPEGRITPEDMGIWDDSQIEPLKRVVDYVHGLRGIIGIQLAHAGRKASNPAPWTLRQAIEDEGYDGGDVVGEENGGWPNNVQAPSAISFNPGKYAKPVEITTDYINNLKKAYADATERCKKIGFDFIEIHGAHGYLLHEFVDPTSNKRTDSYGGSLDNRIRLPLELAQLLREKWEKPLFYRVSATDWLDEELGAEKGKNGDWAWWGIDQTTYLTQKLADLGVDLIDVSSGGNDLKGRVKVGPSYQLPFAEHIKQNVSNILVGAVGIITEPAQANDIIEEGKADVVFLAREVLRDIDFPLKAALELGAAVSPAVQYERAWTRMLVKRDHVKKAAHHHGVDEVQGEEGKKEKPKRNAPPEVHTSVP